MDPVTIDALARLLERFPIIGKYVAPIATVVLCVTGTCAGLSAHLPPPKKPSGGYYTFYRTVNWLGGNYRFARNALDPISAQTGVRAP